MRSAKTCNPFQKFLKKRGMVRKGEKGAFFKKSLFPLPGTTLPLYPYLVFRGFFYLGRKFGNQGSDCIIQVVGYLGRGTADKEFGVENIFEHGSNFFKERILGKTIQQVIGFPLGFDHFGCFHGVSPDRFMEMITSMRRDLGMGDIPVIIGELSELIDPKYNRSEYLGMMNENFAEIARRIPNCGVVSSKGLVLKEDGLHFDAPSLREFGKRYFEVYTVLNDRA